MKDKEKLIKAENDQITKEYSKRGRKKKNLQNTQKATNKMAIGGPYQSIITKCNRINSQKTQSG